MERINQFPFMEDEMEELWELIPEGLFQLLLSAWAETTLEGSQFRFRKSQLQGFPGLAWKIQLLDAK